MKILHGISGGVDSFYSVKLLLSKCFDVKILSFSIFYDEFGKDKLANQVKKIANYYNIDYIVVDSSLIFKEKIVDYFFNEYISGRTPNPCVLCNFSIKFKVLYDYCIENNFNYMSTGHYANVGLSKDRYFIKKGKDINKDQSYFLWKLPQEYLKKIIFPLGDFCKNDVKKNISSTEGQLINNEESNDICFLKDKYYCDYLNTKKKDYFDLKGSYKLVYNDKIVGNSDKSVFYTIGQRSGFNVALGFPVYVQKIDNKSNIIYLAKEELLFRKVFFINNITYQKYENIIDGFCCEVKIRYRSNLIPCRIFKINNNELKIELDTHVKSITPGQSAVFYENEDIVLGGIILDKFY